MDMRSKWVDPGRIDGRDSRQCDASVHVITEQLVRGCSKQVRPLDMRSGWADPGRIDGSVLRAM